MAVFDYPDSLYPQSMEWGSTKSGVQYRSPLSAWTESVIFPGEFWRVSLTLPPAESRGRVAGLAEAFFGRLSGGVDRVRVGHFMRPVPLGTMRGTPTVASSASRGAQTIALTATGTLLAGDFFKVGGQLLRCSADCESVSGTLTVPLVQRLRASVAAGAAVTWDRPTALFVYPAMSFAAGFGRGVAAPISVDLEEVPA